MSKKPKKKGRKAKKAIEKEANERVKKY